MYIYNERPKFGFTRKSGFSRFPGTSGTSGRPPGRPPGKPGNPRSVSCSSLTFCIFLTRLSNLDMPMIIFTARSAKLTTRLFAFTPIIFACASDIFACSSDIFIFASDICFFASNIFFLFASVL